MLFLFRSKNGEPGRIRTFDPLIKSQLLYHLSYGPTATGTYRFHRFSASPILSHQPSTELRAELHSLIEGNLDPSCQTAGQHLAPL